MLSCSGNLPATRCRELSPRLSDDTWTWSIPWRCAKCARRSRPKRSRKPSSAILPVRRRHPGRRCGAMAPCRQGVWRRRLHAVARRTAIDAVRRESRRQLREKAAIEMNVMNAPETNWSGIEPLLDEAVAALDEVDRAAVLLRFFENKSAARSRFAPGRKRRHRAEARRAARWKSCASFSPNERSPSAPAG